MSIWADKCKDWNSKGQNVKLASSNLTGNFSSQNDYWRKTSADNSLILSRKWWVLLQNRWNLSYYFFLFLIFPSNILVFSSHMSFFHVHIPPIISLKYYSNSHLFTRLNIQHDKRFHLSPCSLLLKPTRCFCSRLQPQILISRSFRFKS